MGNEKKNRKRGEEKGEEQEEGGSTGATIDCHKLVAHDVRVAVAVAVVILLQQQQLYLQRDFICEFDELQPKDTSS